MYLKKYQQKVIDNFGEKLHFGLAQRTKIASFKIPTGGGKTVLAGYLIEKFLLQEGNRRTGLVVWLVPSETIYHQTLNQLNNYDSALRQVLERHSFGKVKIFTKNDALLDIDIQTSLCVLIVINNSIVKENKEGYKFYNENSRLLGNFYDFKSKNLKEKKEWHAKFSGLLEFIDESGVPSAHRSYHPKLSLSNTVKFHNPLVIIDEAHKFQGANAQDCLNLLNPIFTIELTATPLETQKMSLVAEVSGKEMWDESMIKLPIQYDSIDNEDKANAWKELVSKAVKLQESLEQVAANEDRYVRPIVVIRTDLIDENLKANPKYKNKSTIFPSDVVEYLEKLGINNNQIRKKSSKNNEIHNENLLSPDCPVRFIITKDAIKEGWDCPFAYILVNLVKPSKRAKGLLTQLVGRVLRQPYTKKFKQAELNCCYVLYNNKEDGPNLYKEIGDELKNEQGLNDLDDIVVPLTKTLDLTKNLKTQTRHTIHRSVKHSSLSILLPKITNGNREIDYYKDIFPLINFKNISLSKIEIEKIREQQIAILKSPSHYFTAYGLKGVEHTFLTTNGLLEMSDFEVISYISEQIQNPFVAKNVWMDLKALLGLDFIPLKENVDIVLTALKAFVVQQSKSIFVDQLNKGVFQFSVDVGPCYSMPFKWDSNYQMSLAPGSAFFEKYKNPNKLEAQFAQEAQNPKFKGWYKFIEREMALSYYIKGWNKDYKVWSDFILLCDKSNNVYIVETKGEQLQGNEDTLYKTDLFLTLNSVTPKAKVNGFLVDLKFKLESANNSKNLKDPKEYH